MSLITSWFMHLLRFALGRCARLLAVPAPRAPGAASLLVVLAGAIALLAGSGQASAASISGVCGTSAGAPDVYFAGSHKIRATSRMTCSEDWRLGPTELVTNLQRLENGAWRTLASSRATGFGAQDLVTTARYDCRHQKEYPYRVEVVRTYTFNGRANTATAYEYARHTCPT